MFGATAVRQKRERERREREERGDQPVYFIKPFGPRFDPSENPYIKYRTFIEAKHGMTLEQFAKKNKDKNENVLAVKPTRDKIEENIFLYIGIGMVSIGLIITCVGLGDKGFHTLQLKLVGPIMVGAGVCLALLRILFCAFPSICNPCHRKIKSIKSQPEDVVKINGVMTKVNEKSSLEKSIKSHGNSTKAKKKCAKTNQIVQEPNSYSNNNPRRREFQEILLSPLVLRAADSIETATM